MTTAPALVRTTMQQAGLSFAGLTRSAWLSYSTLLATRVNLIIGTVLMTGLAAAIIIGMGTPGPGVSDLPPMMVIGHVSIIIPAMAIINGVGGYAKDESSGTVRTVLAAAPRRVQFIASRALIGAGITFVWTVATLVLTIGTVIASAALVDVGLQDDSGRIVSAYLMPILMNAALAACITVIAISFAVLLRSESWAMILSFAAVLMLSTLTLALPFDWTQAMHPYTFGSAHEVLTASDLAAGAETWRAVAVALAWPAVAFAGAALAITKRDA